MRIIAVTNRRSLQLALALLAGVVLTSGSASAATSGAGLYLHGAGNGHGVGMSQYGAAGYALHGASYEEILHDYYAGTTLARVDPNRELTVLLRSSGSAVFSGADAASARTGAPVKLNPLVNYSVVPAAGGRLRLRLGARSIGVFGPPLHVGGPAPLKLIGLGAFRGSLVFRPSARGNGVMTVNSVGLDDYVRGVVAAEMPPSWPAQALEAQAVAARTYALTSKPIGADYDVYDNTRSQMYEGVKAETPTSDAAVAATSGQVVEYAGAPVVTYFFASSGGETESDQNVFPIAPAAWLIGRPDPYDDALSDPYHRWKLSFSLKAAQRRLGRLVDGSLIGIRVLQRGVSPRIITARVVGTKGSVTVTGLQLRKLLGTPSTWMSFTTVSSHGVQTSTTPAATTTSPATTTDTGTTTTDTGTSTTGGGGLIRHLGRARVDQARGIDALSPGRLFAAFVRASGVIARIVAAFRAPSTGYAVSGSVFPASRGAWLTVQALGGRRWRTVRTGRVGVDGRYYVHVSRRGEYRVRFHGTDGPVISVG